MAWYVAALSGSARVPGADCEHRHRTPTAAEVCAAGLRRMGGFSYRVQAEEGS